MNLKKGKLIKQFNEESEKCGEKVDDLFKGVAIFVNGYTDPAADELRNLMIKHGGSYHHYFSTKSTTHIIATNLPDSKLKLTNNNKIVKPSWIIDSIKVNRLLNYRDYLLYTNQSVTQPSLKNLFNEENINRKSNITVKDATHQDFLNEFYNNSRLHHLSTMSTIFKDHINDLRNNKNHKLFGKDELRKSMKLLNNKLFINESRELIMHIDMDCFFVSVGLRNRPDLIGQPVVVTHSNGNQPKHIYKKQLSKDELCNNKQIILNNIDELDSMSEIASCSYEARKVGIKNGMFVGQALKLCPNLKFIHYDFESYKEVSFILYNTVARYTLDIEAVSCDEMYANCTNLLNSVGIHPLEFAKILRTEIKEKTDCPCSVGFGANKLQARLATKQAKPNGQYYLTEENLISFIRPLAVLQLPGVGPSTNYKLKSLGINTCADLQNTSLSYLQEEFGKKFGEILYNYSFGKDDKPLVYTHVRKSISADVNYGIRFQNNIERDNFLKQLSEEVSNRLRNVKMKGRHITLKLMIRSKEAPEETAKYMGHGVCDQISKGATLTSATSASTLIYREALKLMNNLNVDCKDLRGVGIQITRLESEQSQSWGNHNLKRFLNNKQSNDQQPTPCLSKNLHKKAQTPVKTNNNQVLSLSQIDESFLKAMPEDIQEEIIYSLKGDKHQLAQLKVKVKLMNCVKNGDGSGQPLMVDSLKNGQVEDVQISTKDDVLKTYLKPDDLRLLIKQWVESEEVPGNRDLSMVKQYLKHLIAASHLDHLLIILKSFFRYIDRNQKSTIWKEAYTEIVRDIQGDIENVYNSKLFIEHSFF